MNYGASINYLPEIFAILFVILKIAVLCWLFASIAWLRERNRLRSKIELLCSQDAEIRLQIEQLQRGIDAAEGDRHKCSMDAARLQVRCGDLETKLSESENDRRMMIDAKGFILAGPSDDLSEVAKLVAELAKLKEENAQLRALVNEVAP